MPFGKSSWWHWVKESSLIMMVCSTTSKSLWMIGIDFDRMTSNALSSYCSWDICSSSSPCESLQTRVCTSYTCLGSFDVEERDGCVSFEVSTIVDNMLISFTCNSFSHFSFCAINSLTRISSYSSCWASIFFASSASNYLHCASSCYNNFSPSGLCDDSWEKTCTSCTCGNLENASFSTIAWEISH